MTLLAVQAMAALITVCMKAAGHVSMLGLSPFAQEFVGTVLEWLTNSAMIKMLEDVFQTVQVQHLAITVKEERLFMQTVVLKCVETIF